MLSARKMHAVIALLQGYSSFSDLKPLLGMTKLLTACTPKVSQTEIFVQFCIAASENLTQFGGRSSDAFSAFPEDAKPHQKARFLPAFDLLVVADPCSLDRSLGWNRHEQCV